MAMTGEWWDRAATRLRRWWRPGDGTVGGGCVTVAVHDVDRLRTRWSRWDDYPKPVRAHLARHTPPERRQTFSNVQLNGLHRYLVDSFDRGQSPPTREFEEFAVGTDGSATEASDTGLGNQIYQTTVAQAVDEGRDLYVNGFLDSTEANGYTLREYAIVATDVTGVAADLYANRALFDSDVEKTDAVTVSIDATLYWRSE